MEKFQVLIQEAQRKIKVADHMLLVSYKLIEDPKILLSVALSINTAVQSAMNAALEYERLFKRVPVFSDNYDAKYTVFKTKLAPKHELPQDYLKLIRELKEIEDAHKKSPVEFTRKDKFVIASENYELKSLELTDIKKYLAKAKLFIEEMTKITSKNNGIFR